MHYSGILVYAKSDQLDLCIRQVDGCPGVEVHFSYPESSRLIAVLETEDVEAQEEGLRRIQGLPGVAAAELVYHYFGDAGDRDTPSGRQTDAAPHIPQNPSRGTRR